MKTPTKKRAAEKKRCFLRPLTNRQGVRRFTFALIADEFPHLAGKITRIPQDFHESCDANLRDFLRSRLRAAAAGGKTLR